MAIRVDRLVAVGAFDRCGVYSSIPLDVRSGKSLAAIWTSNLDGSSTHNWFL